MQLPVKALLQLSIRPKEISLKKLETWPSAADGQLSSSNEAALRGGFFIRRVSCILAVAQISNGNITDECERFLPVAFGETY